MLDIIKYLNDNDFTINSIKVGPAIPKIITKAIPYSNKILDFSKIMGSYNYEPRQAEIKIIFGSRYKQEFYNRFSLAITKLMESNEIKLKRAIEKGYYKGVVIGSSDIENIFTVGEVTINLRLDPFKYDDKPYGNTLWDTFCFETDYLEQNEYDIADSATIKIYNQGEGIYPSVTATANMNITVDDGSGIAVSYSLNAGTTKLNNKFSNGLNIITVTGTGKLTIEFTQQYL